MFCPLGVIAVQIYSRRALGWSAANKDVFRKVNDPKWYLQEHKREKEKLSAKVCLFLSF